eukprot:scaffold15283_cov155-Isochrysis_galbana.AAC.1
MLHPLQHPGEAAQPRSMVHTMLWTNLGYCTVSISRSSLSDDDIPDGWWDCTAVISVIGYIARGHVAEPHTKGGCVGIDSSETDG